MLDQTDKLLAIDRAQYRTIASNKFLPNIVYVQISRRCNLRCEMCGWKVWKRNTGFMSRQVFDRVLDEMAVNDIRRMAFTGAQGEPLLNPDAESLIFAAIAAGLFLDINTNCTTLCDANIEMLAEACRSQQVRVQASFSGYDKRSHESVYVGSKFEITSRKLRKLFDVFDREWQLRNLSINGIILDGSPVSKHVDYLASIGVDPGKVRARFHGPDNFAGLVESRRSTEGRRLRLCQVLAYELIVYDDGKVSACSCRDSEGVMEIGDIMTEGFVEMRGGERFQSMLDAFMSRDIADLPLCRGCDIPYLGHA